MMAAGTPPILIRDSSPIQAYITLEGKYLSKGIRHGIAFGYPRGYIWVTQFNLCHIIHNKNMPSEKNEDQAPEKQEDKN